MNRRNYIYFPLHFDNHKFISEVKCFIVYFFIIWRKENFLQKSIILLKEFSNINETSIVAHKNVKLFITHGGLFGTMEAIYHGIPMLSFPVFAEQHMNSIRAETNGYGRYISFHDLTEEKMMMYLKELLENPK